MAARSLDDVPVASDDEVATLESTQNGMESTAKGPSSQAESRFSGDNASEDGRASADGRSQRAASIDSAPLWKAVGSTPRFGPVLAQFDEQEFAPFEEGEVPRTEEAPPPANQKSLGAEDRELARERAERLDKYMGEPPRSYYAHDFGPMARKRSWTGSAVSEEERRSARRPRMASGEQPVPPMLPPIRELIGNPWSGMGELDGRNYSFLPPVTMSTPKRPAFVRDAASFHYDDLANVSGHPPTLRGSSIDTTSAAVARDEERGPTRTASRASTRTNLSGMQVDVEPGLDGSSLLERPMSARWTSGSRRDEEWSEGPWNLRNALSEQEPIRRDAKERVDEDFWRGGYRPRNWDEGAERMERRTGVQGCVPDEDEDEGNSEYRRSLFSALPNTKAWNFRRGAMENEERDGRMRPTTPRGRTPSMDYGARVFGTQRSGHADDTSCAQRAGRLPSVGEEDTSCVQRAGGSQSRMDSAFDEDAAASGEEPEDVPEWWQGARTARIPTALLKNEDTEDVPRAVSNPHSDRWTVHLSDPEEHSLVNYRFTKNQEINRHIEANVTAMTTHLTGESGFHVVPPDPEWRHELRARELPYLWVIRGLSEAAAWEMVKLRVISARGVSIITHPKTIGNPRFVCGLAGFLRPDVKTTKVAVLSVLESDYMTGRLKELVRSSDRLSHLPYANHVGKVIESLDIRFMATKEDGYVVNVYVLPPSDDPEEWRVWAEEMRTFRYNVFLNGTGVARRAFWCRGCRGVDHEEQECPFPKMKGWKGPLAERQEQEDGASLVSGEARVEVADEAHSGAARGNGAILDSVAVSSSMVE
ncbi:hypothetical protein C8T65DRAFT_698297 [Cerioporus squamosus]|nr:hypothetical protein C8T65DRAFT_698297 [Cerioporus squamosus]